MPLNQLIEQYTQTLAELGQQDLGKIVAVLSEAKTIYVAGNGGSAATGSHFVADLARIGLRGFCLSNNIASITAFANDVAYEQAFALQLGEIDSKDVLVVLSVSGESSNLIKAIVAAQQSGATTIAFVGNSGGTLAWVADYSVILSSHWYGEVEGVHSCLCHILPVLIKEKREQNAS